MIRIHDQYPLRRGAHDRRDDGMCAMEMVAWLAGEAHSDQPRCACPVIAAFVRALNDLLPDDGERTRLLRPLVPKFVNTAGTAQDERRRGFVVLDGTVRQLLPLCMRALRRGHEAEVFDVAPSITDEASAMAALALVDRFAREQHAVRWMLQRAIEGCSPALYVTGVLQVARRVRESRAHEIAAEIAAEMARAPQSRRVEDKARR